MKPLRFDILVDDCLLLELKAVEMLHPSSKAQLFSYMKLLDIPLGLLINFHEPILKNGVSRMILPRGIEPKKRKAAKSCFKGFVPNRRKRRERGLLKVRQNRTFVRFARSRKPSELSSVKDSAFSA